MALDIRLYHDWDYEDAHPLTWDQQDALNQTNDVYDVRGAYGIASVAVLGGALYVVAPPREWELPLPHDAGDGVQPLPAAADALETPLAPVLVEAIQVALAAELALVAAEAEALQAATVLEVGLVPTVADQVMAATVTEVALAPSTLDIDMPEVVTETPLVAAAADQVMVPTP